MGRAEYLNDPAAPKPNSLVPACGILVVDDRGQILLQRRRDTGQGAIPMGKQELGETPSQCAIRETLEETGISAELTCGCRECCHSR
jgi:8-oxo-dGTP pyrophosphatase MutT (NUDIX family)